MSTLRGSLGFKGEAGASAYEIAVKNGFKGTEQEWLATLGTTSHFSQTKTTYTVTEANVTEINLPNGYLDGSSFLDIFVNGQRLNSAEYSLNLAANKIILTNPLNSIGTIVEMVMVTIATNELPIVEHIDSTYDNNTCPGTKAVYDFVKGAVEEKVDMASIITVTGSIPALESDITTNISVSYPTDMNKNNTIILGVYVIENGILNLYGDGVIDVLSVSLNDENVSLSLQASSETENTYTYKMIVMKVGA